MKQMKSQVLNLKKLKTQVPIRYLTHKLHMLEVEAENGN
jgi:hypothetical protein